MGRLIRWGILLTALVIAGACRTVEPGQIGNEIMFVPDNMISTQQLAQRLGLTVDTNIPAMITLRNASNEVMLVPHAGGEAYVNGKFVKTQVGFTRILGVCFLPDSLEAAIRPVLKPAPEPAPAGPSSARARRIAIDPAHGGDDPGMIGPLGLEDKTVTLAAAQDLARALKEDGFDVVMTRQSDVFVSLDERAEIANSSAADLFVSLHADTYVSPLAEGYTVYTSRDASPESRAAAEAVAGALRKGGIEGMGVRQADYRVLVCVQCPALLVELGYLSNSRDAKLLAEPAYRAKLARSVADGIAEYFLR